MEARILLESFGLGREGSPSAWLCRLFVQVNHLWLKLSQVLRGSVRMFLYNLQNPFPWPSPMRMRQALWMTVQKETHNQMSHPETLEDSDFLGRQYFDDGHENRLSEFN